MAEQVRTVIGADPDARDFIAARGGAVYAWIGPSGFMKVALTRPRNIDFVELRGEGFSLFQDTRIFPPSPELGWYVSLGRRPRRHINVEYATPDSGSGVNWIDVLIDAPWP